MRRHLALEQGNAQQTRPPAARGRKLDELDRAIVEALQRNGRESFRRIAAAQGVSEATVRARYSRLCDDGVMQVVAVTNPLELGFESMALIGIRTTGSPESVADAIAEWDEADYVVITAGQFDVMAELLFTDRRHLLELTTRLRGVGGVVSTETFVYLDMRKLMYDWGTR